MPTQLFEGVSLPAEPSERDVQELTDPEFRANQLEEQFIANLRSAGKKAPPVVHAVATLQTSSPATTASTSGDGTVSNREEILIDLYNVHDGLVKSFEQTNHNSVIADSITRQINRIGGCIRKLGGEIGEFVPLDHVSGLQAPDMLKNAQRVVETTKQCYALGKITNTVIEDSGRTVKVTFLGRQDNGVPYIAEGEITAKGRWRGNEAVDYVYTPGAGKMFVRAFEEDGWTDKSDEFDIGWTLDENPDPEKLSGQESAKNTEGNTQENSNNVSAENNTEEGLDFPISQVS